MTHNEADLSLKLIWSVVGSARPAIEALLTALSKACKRTAACLKISSKSCIRSHLTSTPQGPHDIFYPNSLQSKEPCVFENANVIVYYAGVKSTTGILNQRITYHCLLPFLAYKIYKHHKFSKQSRPK